MSRLPLAQWDPTLFTDLQHLLALVSSQPTTSLVKRLYARLDQARPWILTLTALPTPNEEDKKIIASSPIASPDGSEVHVRDELLVTTNLISEQLNISQLLAAVIALHAIQQRVRFPARSDAEIAVYILHEVLKTLLDFVRELFRLTVGPDAEQGEPFDELRVWVEDLLEEKGAGGGYLVEVLIDQLDALQSRLDALVRTQASGAQFELLNFRVTSLRAEQNQLAGILGTLALAGLLKSSQIVKIIKWLKKCTRPDAVVAAVFAAFCAATQPLDSLELEDPRFESVKALTAHFKFSLVVSNVVFGETFGVPLLREAVKLQWTQFYLSALQEETASALVQTVQMGADAAERHLQEAVAAGAFQFISRWVSSLAEEPEDPTAALAGRSDPANNRFLYVQLQQLTQGLASKRNFLRNLKNKEEDIGLRRSQQTPQANFQAFLCLLATVYAKLPPDSAVRLWDEPSFTSVALDIRTTFPTADFWDMIDAISSGPCCSSKCYEKLKDTRLAWTALFKFYHHYIEVMPHLFETIKTTRQVSHEPIADDDLFALIGWTRLLATVIRGSVVARGALLQLKPHPLQTLFEFTNCDIPTDLKALVLEAITAFVKRRGDSADEDVVARAVEYYERVSFADPTLEVREGSRVPPPIGWIQKMEFSESDVGFYPLTRAYLDFLTALMPSEKARINNALRRGAIYVIDRVLLSTRRYSSDSEHWEVLSAIVRFFEKALLTFDMTDLLSPTRSAVSALADQPGFVVLLRLLSESAVFSPLADVVDHASSMTTTRPEVVKSCLVRVLRIYNRVLNVQLVFNDVLLNSLSSASGFKRPLALQPLDNYLLNHLSNVTAIALLVGDDDLAISFMCVKIISALASSRLFSGQDVFRGEYANAMNRLAGIIDASDESIRIAQGFCNRLESEGEDLSPEEIDAAVKAAVSGEDAPKLLPIVIRSAILDLLVEHTTASAGGPNIAHFLLGFDFRARELGLQNPNAPGSRLSCLSVILDQLNETPPLIQLHPVLASKSAQLLYQLFEHPTTGPSTISHAVSYEGFPAFQLSELPRVPPDVSHEAEGMGIASTVTEQVETSAGALVAWLNYERYILSSVALQTFSFEGRGPMSDAVASLLFAADDSDEGDQRPPLIIDLVTVVDIQFTEDDTTDAAQNKTLEFYSGFAFDEFKRSDTGCYEIDDLRRALRAHRRQLERQGAVIPGTSADAMASEAEYIIRRLSLKNRETRIAIAKGSFLSAWSEVLKVSLAMLFHSVPEDRRDVLLFELLDVILNRLQSDHAPGVLDILCEAVLMTLMTLVNLLAQYDGPNLPADRLASTLSKIVDAVVRPGTTEAARGNLYAAVSQFLQLVPDDPNHAIHRATVQTLASRKDRFVSMLCRDAMDMRDVWKTECYMLLASIVSLGERALTSPLTKIGYLAQMVRSLKDREMALQECLSPQPDNLHAYWVYEAKCAFLVAYAATPKGADDLVEASIFQTFATSAYIAVQPFSDDVLSDVVAFETVQRQHRVFICALQVLVRILSHPTRSGLSDAYNFLNAHRESLLVLLRENQAFVTVMGVEESRLVIALLTLVVSKVPEKDLRSASGFGAFHLAVLSLAAKFFDKSWADLCRDEAAQAEPKVLELNQVILTYLCQVTRDLKGGSGQPVFVTGVARASGAQYIASAPSIPAAVDLIADLAEAVQDVSNAYDDVAQKLENDEAIALAPSLGIQADELTDLSGLGELHDVFSARVRVIYNMIDSLLLLLWRHLLFYVKDASGGANDPVRPDTLSLAFSTARMSTASAGPGAASLKSLEHVAAQLRGVLSRLDDVDASISGGDDLAPGRKDDAYHSMLVRRLRELCAGLGEP